MKKKIIIFATLVALLLAGCGAAEKTLSENKQSTTQDTSSEKLVINVGDPGPNIPCAQFIIAYQNGYFNEVFAEDNVEVVATTFKSGPACNEAFIAGEIDFVNGMGDQPITVGIGKDIKTSVIAGAAKGGKKLILLAKSDSGINSISDLKGKTVGVQVGTTYHKSLLGLLESEGVTEADIELANISSASDAEAAFANNDIDAYLGSNGYYVKTSLDSGDFISLGNCENYPAMGYIVASNDFLEQHPDLTLKFLQALVKGQEFFDANPEEAYQLIADYAGIDDVNQVKYTIEGAQGAGTEVSLNWDSVFEDNLVNTYNFLISHDLAEFELTEEDIRSHVNTSFLDQVISK